MRQTRWSWLALVLSLWLPQLMAEPIQLSGRQCCDPQQSVRVLSDPGGQLTLAQVQSLADSFQMPLQADLSYGYRQGAIWLQLAVVSPEQSTWWWRFVYPSLDQADLYLADVDGVRHYRAGDLVPLAERPLVHREVVFPLALKAGQPATLWIRVESAGSMTLQGELLSNQAFIEHTAGAYLAPALYFGALLALAGYNFLLFLVLRERPFLWYVLFVLCFGVGAASLNGLGAVYLWPQLQQFGNHLLPLGFTAASLMAVLFTRDFLDTRRFNPGWDQYLRLMSWLMSASVIAVLLMPVQAALVVMSLIGILVVLVLTLCAVQSVRRRAPGAPLFALAWSMLLLGTVLMSLRNLGLLPSNFFTIHAMQLGSALEMLLVSLGLAARFNRLKQSHSEAQQQALAAQQQLVAHLQQQEHLLAAKVAERTSELASLNQQLQQLATTDPLTGLANRNRMYTELQQAIARARRNRRELALLYVDLDGFKAVNDQFGHRSGDAILQQVAQRLSQTVRESDQICRIGGDEFLIICEGLGRGTLLLDLTSRLLTQMRQPFVWQQQQVQLGASIGVVVTDGRDNDMEHLLEQADKAMYQAKAAGRNCVQLAPAIS